MEQYLSDNLSRTRGDKDWKTKTPKFEGVCCHVGMQRDIIVYHKQYSWKNIP